MMSRLRAMFGFKNGQNMYKKKKQIFLIPIGSFNKGGKPRIFIDEDMDRVWKILLETKNVSETARQLGCSRSTIKRFMKRFPRMES